MSGKADGEGGLDDGTEVDSAVGTLVTAVMENAPDAGKEEDASPEENSPAVAESAQAAEEVSPETPAPAVVTAEVTAKVVERAEDAAVAETERRSEIVTEEKVNTASAEKKEANPTHTETTDNSHSTQASIEQVNAAREDENEPRMVDETRR